MTNVKGECEMFTINENYLKLPGSYLFSDIAKKIAAYQQENPEKEIIRLGIGDVTQPLAPVIIQALHSAVEEMAHGETFHGYAPDKGYGFLREAIAKNDFQDRGCRIDADEIFVSDGAKCDSGNIQEILALNNKIAVCDPVYPVYVDTNVMAGRTGGYNPKTQNFDGMIYMPWYGPKRFCAGISKGNAGCSLSLFSKQSYRRCSNKSTAAGMGGLCQQKRNSHYL